MLAPMKKFLKNFSLIGVILCFAVCLGLGFFGYEQNLTNSVNAGDEVMRETLLADGGYAINWSLDKFTGASLTEQTGNPIDTVNVGGSRYFLVDVQSGFVLDKLVVKSADGKRVYLEVYGGVVGLGASDYRFNGANDLTGGNYEVSLGGNEGNFCYYVKKASGSKWTFEHKAENTFLIALTDASEDYMVEISRQSYFKLNFKLTNGNGVGVNNRSGFTSVVVSSVKQSGIETITYSGANFTTPLIVLFDIEVEVRVKYSLAASFKIDPILSAEALVGAENGFVFNLDYLKSNSSADIGAYDTTDKFVFSFTANEPVAEVSLTNRLTGEEIATVRNVTKFDCLIIVTDIEVVVKAVTGYEISRDGAGFVSELDDIISASGSVDYAVVVRPMEREYTLYGGEENAQSVTLKLVYGSSMAWWKTVDGEYNLLTASSLPDMPIVGYHFSNISVKSVDGSTAFLIFGADFMLWDSSAVLKIENMGEDFLGLYAEYSANISNIVVDLGALGGKVYGYISFDSNLLYMRSKIASRNLFSLVSLTVAGSDPAIVFGMKELNPDPEADANGLYIYELDANWKVDIAEVELVPSYDYKYFKATFLRYGVSGENATYEVMVQYGATANLYQLSLGKGEPILPIKKGYDLIGWAMNSGDAFYTLDDEVLWYGDEEFTWRYEEDMEFVPVFSPKHSRILFDANGGVFASGDTVLSALQTYDKRATTEGLTLTPLRAGYRFLGYYTTADGEGSLVMGTDEQLLELDGFLVLHGVFLYWEGEEELTVYARYETIVYDVEFRFNGELVDKKEFTVESDPFVFDFASRIAVSDFVAYVAVNGNKVLTNAMIKGAFENAEITSFEFNLGAKITYLPESGATTIVVNAVTAKKVFFLQFGFAFVELTESGLSYLDSSVLIYSPDRTISTDQIMWVHYLAEYGSGPNEWAVANADGVKTGATGWQSVNFFNGSRYYAFLKEYLSGSGLSITVGDAAYGLKGFVNPNDNTKVVPETVVTKNLVAECYFSSNADVKISYYLFNGTTYQKVDGEALFFNYLGQIKTKLKNAYDCFLINGNVCYITAWKAMDGEVLSALMAGEAGTEALLTEKSWSIGGGEVTLNYYAVYAELTLVKNGDSVECALPNDAYGNTYSAEDVKLETIDGEQYLVVYRKNENGEATAIVYAKAKVTV